MIAGFLRLFVFIGIPLWIVLYYISKFKETKDLNKIDPNSNLKSSPEKKDGYSLELDSLDVATLDFKVAGVTFKDGRRSRQATLRKIKFKDEPMDGPIDFEFEEYDYNGEPAVLIKANGLIIGNVPADLVNKFLKYQNTYKDIELNYKVTGGGDYNFGCKMIITWRNKNGN